MFKYVLRVFAEGDVALPGQGMEAIVNQVAEELPHYTIETGAQV